MSVTQSRISHNNPKLNKIIDVDDTKVQNTVKQKVKQKLTQDAQYLLEKKKRQDQKKEKVKKMEEQFEKQRFQKMKLMSEKQAKSEEVRQKNKQEKEKKFKQKSQQFKKIVNKIEHHNVEQIQKALSLQKQYQSSNTSNFSKTSQDNSFKQLNSGRAHSLRFRIDNVEQKISNIMNKGTKAQKQHEQINKLMIDRIRQKTKNIQQVQQRALHISLVQQSHKLKNYYEKKEQLQKISSNCKYQSQLRILQKRKSVKQKLDKCSQNLKHLSYLQQQKFQELQNKFNKKAEPKKWKDIRLQKYKQKWQQNSKKLELQKQQKAQQILNKHQQITQQHKIYKEQKDKLIQAVKYAS